MSDYDNSLSGALFKNDKGDNPKRPDYKGFYTDAEGREFWVSSWLKESKDGKKFLSLSMQPKETAHTPKKEFASAEKEDTSGDLPF
jgi:uncharacterized protein (DUF736 family)